MHCYCGHSKAQHENNKGNCNFLNDSDYYDGCECGNYRPIPLSKIVEWFINFINLIFRR